MKTLLLTGATGGLGIPCVRLLSRTEKWKVFAAGTNKDKLAYLGSLPNVVPLFMDLKSVQSIQEARRVVGLHTESLDALVNLAGLSGFASLVEGESLDEISRLLEINVLGTARVNHVFFDLIRAGRGRIVNCSSEAGWMKAQPFAGPYYLSKRALEAYNDSLRRELMFLGIPVIVLRPGSFDTRLTHSIFESFDKVSAATKLYREVLRGMRPLMAWELNRKNNPELFARLLAKVLETPRPKPYYRLGTGWMLLALESIPESWMDKLYLTLFKYWRKIDK